MRLKKLGVLGMFLLMAFCGACTQVSPLAVSGPGSRPGGPCSNSGGPHIYATIYRNNQMTAGVLTGSSHGCLVFANDCAGPISLTGATLNPPGGGTVALTMAGIDSMTFEAAGTGWTFQPDQAYTVNVTVWGATYSATISPKGGSAVIPSFASGGGPITWTNPGNSDQVMITHLGGGAVLHNFYPVLSGAVSTANASLFPGPDSYSTIVKIAQQNFPSAFGAGAHPYSTIDSWDSYRSDDSK